MQVMTADEQRLHDRRWWALATMCMSILILGLDNTILNIAIPALVRDLHASTSQLQWIVDGYTLVFAGLLLTAGSIGDRFGRKGALTVGLTIFGLGSLASALAGSANMLIFTRAFMGLGAALVMPATLSLLTNVFRDPKERARAIGAWAAVVGAASALGPIVGGFLLQHFWWGSVFLVNLPVVAVALIAGHLLLPTSRDPAAPRLDPIGALLSITGLVALLWAVIQAPSAGWTDPGVLGAFGLGGLIVVAFVLWEGSSSHPMLDVRFFRNRRFSAANVSITLVFFAMLGASFIITQYLQTVLGFDALQAGFRMLPMAIVLLVVAPLAPRLVERVGTKLVVGSGLSIAAIGLVAAANVPLTNGYPHLVWSMSLMSFGMALVMAPATESIMGSLPRSKAGIGSAMNDTTRQMGGAVGVAVLGSVLASSYRPAVTSKLTALGAPTSVVNAAKESIGGAVDAASKLPAPLAREATVAAQRAFVDALSGTLILAAVVIIISALVVFAFLPARAVDAVDDDDGPRPETALDGLASLAFAEAEQVLETAVAEEAQETEPETTGVRRDPEPHADPVPSSGPFPLVEKRS
ncbi:MAG: drug resistance transporter [Actinomycetia bacterium]|nr:drug resistance transporter [Actinomycetes bacterium]